MNYVKMKFDELQKREIMLLEKTKNNKEQYSKERKTIWSYITKRKNTNLTQEYIEEYNKMLDSIEATVI